MKQGCVDNVYIFKESKRHLGISQVIYVYEIAERILKEQENISLNPGCQFSPKFLRTDNFQQPCRFVLTNRSWPLEQVISLLWLCAITQAFYNSLCHQCLSHILNGIVSVSKSLPTQSRSNCQKYLKVTCNLSQLTSIVRQVKF